MFSERALRKADVLTASVLLLTGLGVFTHALTMPMGGTYGGVDNAWYVSPAIFPLILGGLLVVSALSLLHRAIRRGGAKDFIPYFRQMFQLPANRVAGARIVGIAGILVLYVLLLRLHWFSGLSSIFAAIGFGRVIPLAFLTSPEGANYYLSSVVFLFVFTEVFFDSQRLQPALRHSLLVLLALLVPLFIGFVFSYYLRVPLP